MNDRNGGEVLASGFPSQSQVNRAIRVLTGERKKYTVRIFMPDGSETEFQSDKPASLRWNNEARALWIVNDEFPEKPVMAYRDGMAILSEENPTP